MTKSGLLLAATAVFGIGAAMWLLRDLKGTASPAAPLIGASGTISAQEHRSLLVRYDGAVSRQQALERENAVLRRRLEELGASGDGAAVAADGAADGAPAESTGIDWSAYSRLLRQNLELLDRNHLASGLTDAEIASLTALEGELLRISGRARALSPAPLFDAAIFTELTRSLFKDALGLSDEQFAAVDEANRALFESLPEDLDALTPLERFRLKQGMAGHVWDAVEGVLDDEQRQHWEPVRKYSERLFREGQLWVTGLDLERPDVQVLFQLRDAYGLTGEQAESVRPWVPDYIQSAREIMARYAATKEELDALAISGRRALETEFLDLQERHERQILPLLGEEQRRKALAGEPRILHFSYGNSVMGNAYGPGLF
jgi:hypothetical protein